MHLDGARDEVGATVEPIRLIHPDVLLGIFQGFLVGRTVFEPKQIARGRTRLIVGVKPRLAPAHGDIGSRLPYQLTHRVKRHLRIIGTTLDAKITAAQLGLELIAWEQRQIAELLRRQRGQSQLFEKGRRNPKRQCQTIRAQIVGLAGVFGRYKWVVAIRHDVCTLGQFRRKRRPLFKHVFDRLDVLGVQIHDQKVNVFLRGRDNPCLMRTVKRMRLLGDGVVIDRGV